MKLITDLQKAITKLEFYDNQFKDFDKKHILTLTCQLSAKDFYTKILPFAGLYGKNNTLTAMINLDKYDPEDQLTDLNVFYKKIEELIWADFIIVPFTIRPLSELFKKIKQINPKCKLIFWVDYNFYELPEADPFKKHFTPETIQIIEKNIWSSDICRVSQNNLHSYLANKLNQLAQTTFKDIHTSVSLDCQPILINEKLCLENVDYNPQIPQYLKQNNSDNKPTTALNKQQENIQNTNNDTGKILVVFENEKWVIKKSKNDKPTQEFETKQLAVTEATKLHKNGMDLIVYTAQGVVHFQKLSKKTKDEKKQTENRNNSHTTK